MTPSSYFDSFLLYNIIFVHDKRAAKKNQTHTNENMSKRKNRRRTQLHTNRTNQTNKQTNEKENQHSISLCNKNVH